MPIRVVLADDHPIVLHGLETLLARHGDIEVVAGCADGLSAVEAVRRLKPDVLVADLKMPRQSGLDVVRTLTSEKLPCRSVLLTAAISHEEVLAAVRLGVAGLVLKESAPDNLVACIRRVYNGGEWIDQDTVTRAFRNVIDQDQAERAATETLTPREREIVRMVGEGLRNKNIADRMRISEGTVKVHLHNIYEKLGVDGRLELLVAAQQRRLI